jgi:hypothetical protein
MKALVVYESMYGNTMAVAQAVADGLGDAETIEVGAAPTVIPPEVELLVVGGPTHAHGMSKPQTRADAAGREAEPVFSKGDGVREWTERLSVSRPTLGAAFDTRVPGPELLMGAASKGVAKQLKARRVRVVATTSFVLDGVKGPLHDRIAPDELERARAWGRKLAAILPVEDDRG